MFDFPRGGASGSLEAVDLMENKKSWAQISVLAESLKISVPCSKVTAKYILVLHISRVNSKGDQS